MFVMHLLSLIALLFSTALAQCPDYLDYALEHHGPYTPGRFNLSYQRPEPACRTFNSSAVEDVLLTVMNATTDLDLFRLFLNG